MGNANIIAAALIEEQQRREEAFRRHNLRRKNLRDSSNPFFMEAEQFRRYYRLPPHLALNLVDELSDRLSGQRSTKIPPHLQVLTALRFYAEGPLQKGLGCDHNHPMCATTVSNILRDVTDAIIDSMSQMYIKFPTTREERENVAAGRLNRIQSILGAMDCVKVIIFRPQENEEAFYNHMVASSAVNIQAIATADYIIQNIRICPGNCNDQFIWQYSEAKQYLEYLRRDNQIMLEEGSYYLIADSGYSLSPVLLTPIQAPAEGSPDEAYSKELTKTRVKVENTFGILSNVWRCLSRSRKLYYRPQKVAKFVTACAVLHNYRIMNGAAHDEDLPPVQNNFDNDYVDVEINQDFDYQNGLAELQNIINNFYN